MTPVDLSRCSMLDAIVSFVHLQFKNNNSILKHISLTNQLFFRLLLLLHLLCRLLRRFCWNKKKINDEAYK